MMRSLACAVGRKGCFEGCAYHDWVRAVAGDDSCRLPDANIPDTIARTLLMSISVPPVLVQIGVYRPKRQRTCEFSPTVVRLLEYLRLARKFDTAPWASAAFDVNHDIFIRLTASHMHLIVGAEGAKAERSTLLRILAAHQKLDGCSNLVWITNRQQGKTTTIGKFLALLATTSDAGGLLATIYSTSLDRAVELVKAAKQYLYWHRASGGQIRFVRDCERTFVLANGLAENEVGARPKNVDSCRGDAPSAAFFDEVGFIGEDFWYKFAYPLLQVTGRIFTCITTPPPVDGFFATFVAQVKARNVRGDRFFFLVNHSLACEDCVKLNEPERCCHRLHLIPPWKSVLRFAAMRRLVPQSKKESFAQEVFGVITDNARGYFPPPLVDASFARSVPAPNVTTIWVGVDPASHGKSELGLVAMSVSSTGLHIIHGLASVNVHRCEMAQLSAIVRQFAGRLRALHPGVNLVPIIETNNNEIAAMTLLRAFGPVLMPFTRDKFEAYITPDIGVLTTQATKLSMIQQTYLAIINGQIAVAAATIVADRTAFEDRARAAEFPALATELGNQLKRFADRPDGTISGKTLHGENDDMAIAIMLCVYWRICVLSSNTTEYT